MANDIGPKTCSKCGESKPLEKFVPDKSRRGGRRSYCTQCRYRDRRLASTAPARRRTPALRASVASVRPLNPTAGEWDAAAFADFNAGTLRAGGAR